MLIQWRITILESGVFGVGNNGNYQGGVLMSKGNRCFAVKIKLYMPWVSNPKAWSPTYIEDLLMNRPRYLLTSISAFG